MQKKREGKETALKKGSIRVKNKGHQEGKFHSVKN